MYKEAAVLRDCEASLEPLNRGFRSSDMKCRMRAIKLPTTRFQQPSVEPLDCFVRRAMPAGLRAFTSRLSGRTSALPRSLPSRSATSSAMRSVSRRVFQMYRCAHTPNQALQPTRMLVTFHAYAWPAPSTRVAVMRTL